MSDARILLIEDDERIREIVERGLASRGFAVSSHRWDDRPGAGAETRCRPHHLTSCCRTDRAASA